MATQSPTPPASTPPPLSPPPPQPALPPALPPLSPPTTAALLERLEANGWRTAPFRAALSSAHLPPACGAAAGADAAGAAADAGAAAAAAADAAGAAGAAAAADADAAPAPPPPPPVSVHAVVAAQAAEAYGRIRRFVRHTPLEGSAWLGGMAPGAAGCWAAMKLESEQASGSFKARGAVNKLLSLPPAALSRGVFTASTGNHALAVLYAASVLPYAAAEAEAEAEAEAGPVDGSPCSAHDGGGGYGAAVRPVLYLPETASEYKVRRLRALGGDIVLHGGADCLDAEAAARAAAAAAGGTYVSPYNDVAVMAGQGTLALELLADRRAGQLDVVFVPVGGGGLIGGVASVLKAADPGIWVVGCQPAASDVMARSVAAGAVQPELPYAGRLLSPAPGGGGSGSTLSDATAGGVEAGSVTLGPCMACVDEWVVVGEEEIAAAMVGLLEAHAKLVEGAAAVALAAFRRCAARLEGKAAVVVCCGGNVSLPALRTALQHAGGGGGGGGGEGW